MTYQEYLKQNGATDEDVKLLATPIAIKAFDAMQAQLAKETSDREKAQKDWTAIDEWYRTQAVPSYEAKQRELVAAQAETARVQQLLKSAQDQGLIELARAAGEPPANVTPPNGTPAAGAAAPDLSKYATVDSIKQLADSAGEGLADMQDVVLEHMQLFPNQILNVRELRAKALAAHKLFRPYWEETFKVAEARAARTKAAQDAHDQAIRDEATKAERERLASQYGNPETRPLTPSTSPLAARAATGRDKQPWEIGDSNFLSGDRVTRTAKHVMEKLVQ